jgi:hypothetical protein
MSNNVGSVKSVFEIGGEALKLFPFLDEIILIVFLSVCLVCMRDRKIVYGHSCALQA